MNYKRPRIKKNESYGNYSERCRLSEKSKILSRGQTQEEYIKTLKDIKAEYVEIHLEKPNGRALDLVIPACQFKAMSRTDINKLFKV